MTKCPGRLWHLQAACPRATRGRDTSMFPERLPGSARPRGGGVATGRRPGQRERSRSPPGEPGLRPATPTQDPTQLCQPARAQLCQPKESRGQSRKQPGRCPCLISRSPLPALLLLPSASPLLPALAPLPGPTLPDPLLLNRPALPPALSRSPHRWHPRGPKPEGPSNPEQLRPELKSA